MRHRYKPASSADMEVETSFGFSFEFSLFGMGSFVDKEELDLNKADVEVVADERRARPPPEPPPWTAWSASKSRVWKKMSDFYFNFVLSSLCFSVKLYVVWSCFGICFFVYFPVCKTLILDMGGERNMVTVYAFLFPGYGSANFIATVINSESGSRDNGYQFSFCQLTHTLNYGVLVINLSRIQ
ncbi:unnamed protein product [Cuscuta epithymum]|uniref:Uncharacterized protein n=1 Tax=Cuscuta epithymum TaxID=186058 RepID=A0AAV0G7U1_9ASTE|nr:unnamed protein product [Cuscuta epithymum]